MLGAGVEYAWTNNLTVKLEGLWVSMDSNSNNLGFGNGIIGVSNTGAPIRSNVFTPSASSDNEFFVARVGINYKFELLSRIALRILRARRKPGPFSTIRLQR